MDEFVLNYTLDRLEKKIDHNEEQFGVYKTDIASQLAAMIERTENLETKEESTIGVINSLIQIIDTMGEQLDITKAELNKVQLSSIKQEIVVRTLHNLQYFEAHDMYVDTFADTENIDADLSIRGEWFEVYQAIGKTSDAYVRVQQTSIPERILIGADGSSDQSIVQSFKIDKTQDIGKISFFAEIHNVNSWQPIEVHILDKLGGTPLTSATVKVDRIFGQWIDVDLPRAGLEMEKEYFLEIKTKDPYGYRIGIDKKDTYLPGTAYTLYNGTHLDANYDIGFKIWCFPAEDENNATFITKVREFQTPPRAIVFEAEDIIIDGAVQYFVSRDDGENWKILQPGIETSLEDIPEGTKLRLKIYIIGSSRVNALGYVIKRGDKS